MWLGYFIEIRKLVMTHISASFRLYNQELRAAGLKHTFENSEGNLVSCYGVSDDDANHYRLFVGSEEEGILKNPDKLGWEEVSSFLEGQPDDWTEVFGVSHQPEE